MRLSENGGSDDIRVKEEIGTRRFRPPIVNGACRRMLSENPNSCVLSIECEVKLSENLKSWGIQGEAIIRRRRRFADGARFWELVPIICKGARKPIGGRKVNKGGGGDESGRVDGEKESYGDDLLRG